MNPYTSIDPWWQQTNDFYQHLESEFGFPPASINESQLSDIFTSFDKYSDPTTPSSSDTSHKPSIDSSGSSLSSSFGPVKTVNVERIERRRAQNRSAQRAYRDRIALHQKELKGTIAELQTEHARISRCCKEQSIEVCQLKSRIRELDRQLAGTDGREDLLSTSGRSLFLQVKMPVKFDLVPRVGKREVKRSSSGDSQSIDSGRSTR